MSLRRAITGFGLLGGVVFGTTLLSACGGGGDGAASADQAASADDRVVPGPPAAAGGPVAREDLVVCPAVEGIADELAAIANFQIDTDRGVEAMFGECFVRGEGGSFASVALVPAFVQSIAMHASAYEAAATPAPALGENAVLIEDRVQPHVIFELLGHIIDVGMEGPGATAPDAAATIRAGILVRDALLAANAG